ncbi:nuclear-pore anchor [Dorcoceras hygrometricum]|uniref:Nuclear-pore anchor n=1 Tax=Dorcoceras hygrometricum TaxID=472368 RepID=A0A2Z7BJC0_9LAMI|nr:nuclear-pore anchor [Dorcoceras hygrometricum]
MLMKGYAIKRWIFTSVVNIFQHLDIRTSSECISAVGYIFQNSSSSDSEQEEVHCLMADQTSDDEEVKAENDDLKNSSVEPSTVELGEDDSLKIELNKLMAENELLRNESSELKAEIEKLSLTMSSWRKSSASLDKLFGIQKPVSDRTDLGFNSSESSEGKTSTQSQLVYDKFNKMSFVKDNVIYDYCESMTYNDQTSQKLNHKGKAGIDFQRPENSKPSWLKNKLDKDKAKAGSKSFVPNQPSVIQRRSSTSMSYVSPSSSSEGSTRIFDLYIVYRPDPATSSCENS